MPAPPPSRTGTRVALDELIALDAYARGSGLALRRRRVAQSAGGHLSRWRGRGVDYRESRVYQPGDDIRHMDWRVTARSGRPHTKLFQEEREQGLLIACDFNPSMRFGTRVRFKNVQAARAGALLAWLTAHEGDRVGAVGFGGDVHGEVRPGGGRRGVLRALRALRDWDVAATGAIEPLSSGLQRVRRLLRPGMRLVLLTDGMSVDDAGVRLLVQLAARHDLGVVLLRDALEVAPPPPGRYALHLGRARRVLDFGDARLRVAWSERFTAARERLRGECLRIGVRALDLDTDADLRRALAPLLVRSHHATGVA
jgi:uncharacterized protein (DUF58 family)